MTSGPYTGRRETIHYKLMGRLAVPCKDFLEWGDCLRSPERHVGDEHVGAVRISTVFLGIDQNHGFCELPILFETMVFRGGQPAECWRYETWDEAETGHKAAVALVRAEIKEKVNE